MKALGASYSIVGAFFIAEQLLLALVGGVAGPHLLASHGNSALASWGLGAAVTVIVAACLFVVSAAVADDGHALPGGIRKLSSDSKRQARRHGRKHSCTCEPLFSP